MIIRGPGGMPPPGIMQQIMQDMLSRGMPPGGSSTRVRISGTTGPDGQMIIRQEVISGPGGDDDDDDDGPPGVPPEILQMMRMTEQMHMRHNPFNPFASLFGRKKEQIVRQDESHEDVMKRMNALSDEITEKNRNKYEFKDNRQERMINVMICVGAFLLLILVSFILTC